MVSIVPHYCFLVVFIENFLFFFTSYLWMLHFVLSPYNKLIKSIISKEINMQIGNHETYIRKYNYIDSLSCYEKIKQDILTKLKEN